MFIARIRLWRDFLPFFSFLPKYNIKKKPLKFVRFFLCSSFIHAGPLGGKRLIKKWSIEWVENCTQAKGAEDRNENYILFIFHHIFPHFPSISSQANFEMEKNLFSFNTHSRRGVEERREKQGKKKKERKWCGDESERKEKSTTVNEDEGSFLKANVLLEGMKRRENCSCEMKERLTASLTHEKKTK